MLSICSRNVKILHHGFGANWMVIVRCCWKIPAEQTDDMGTVPTGKKRAIPKPALTVWLSGRGVHVFMAASERHSKQVSLLKV